MDLGSLIKSKKKILNSRLNLIHINLKSKLALTQKLQSNLTLLGPIWAYAI